MHCGTVMNVSHFGVKRSTVTVMVEYSVLETALLAFATPLGGGVPYSPTWRRVIFYIYFGSAVPTNLSRSTFVQNITARSLGPVCQFDILSE